MKKSNIKNNDIKKAKQKKSLFAIWLVFITLILLIISVLVWYNTRETALLQISQNTSSKAEYYANEIELKNNKIESVLQEIANNNVPEFNKPDTHWNEQANSYIQNFEGIESIIWVDKGFSIKEIISISNTDFFINQNVKSFPSNINHLHSLTPSYKDNELKGFIFSEISIIKLVLSVTREARDNYEIQLYNEEELIFTSDNWELSKNNLTIRMQFDLTSSDSYYLVLKPSDDLLRDNTTHSNFVLLFGFLLSLSVVIVSWIAQSLNSKSNQLTQTQEILILSKIELENKNKDLQKQIKNQQKLESIGILASGVAHEINTPINGVLNYSQLIMDSSDANSQNILFSKEIIFEIKRIEKLIANILSFSRQETEAFSIVRIEQIIERSTNLVQTILKKDQISLNINISEDLPYINCRSQQIQQVIINLLINARDALNDKYHHYNEDKIITISVDVIEADNKKCMRIIIEDHGQGIPTALQAKIFDQFFTTKDIGKGTGLGLSISLEIVKEHNGHLTFETEDGKYTKFYIDIPVEE